MMPRLVLDVSDLPEVDVKSSALLWWGNVLMLVIEGTLFAMVVATYFYVRSDVVIWPPPTVEMPGLVLPTIALALFLLSVIPMVIADKAALKMNRARTRLGLVVGAAFGIGLLVLRGFELASLNFKWNNHAYGSVVWLLLGLHTFHVLISTLETCVLSLLFVFGPVEVKHFLDARLDGLYWYWVVAWYVVVYLLVDIAPYLFR